jgi:hypothetical protein
MDSTQTSGIGERYLYYRIIVTAIVVSIVVVGGGEFLQRSRSVGANVKEEFAVFWRP